MMFVLKRFACAAALAALVLSVMAAGVASLFSGSENAAEPFDFQAAARVAPEGTAAAAELPDGFHALDKNIGFFTDFEGTSEPIRIMAADSAVFGGFAPAPDNKRVIMEDDENKKPAEDTPAPQENSTAGGNSGAGEDVTKPQNGREEEKSPAAIRSGISDLIRNRAYTGGLDIFQSERGDIPADTSALMNAVRQGSNTCSFIAVRLSDGASVAYNVNSLYRCASSYKAFVSLFAFRQADAGVYNLNTPLTYTGADYYPGSGIIKSSAIGTVYSLRTVADYSIRYSDNVAFMMLQRYINRSALVEYGRSIGCPNYANFKNTWPDISALDAALWWTEIYSFANSSTYGKQLYDICLSATHPCIRKALGDEYAVAHKSGSMSYYFHDAGIVHSEDPYLLVVLTHNPYNYSSDNQGYLAPIVREIDKLINR